MSGKLTEAEFVAIRERLNSAIHEIVFAVKHAEEDNLDDAATCIVVAQGTLDGVANELVRKEEE